MFIVHEMFIQNTELHTSLFQNIMPAGALQGNKQQGTPTHGC